MDDKGKDQSKISSEHESTLPAQEENTEIVKSDNQNKPSPPEIARLVFKMSGQQTLNLVGMGHLPTMISEVQSMFNNNGSSAQSSEKEIENMYIEERQKVFLHVEQEKALDLRKERAIIELMEKSEEVEIEEMGDNNKAFSAGVSINQNGGGAHLGTQKGVSYYRRYKFKRGGQTTEIEMSPEGQEETEEPSED